MKRLFRGLITTAVIASLVAGPATLASADTGSGAAIVTIEESECPEGYTGVVLDFYIGDPPRHVYTLRACQNIIN